MTVLCFRVHDIQQFCVVINDKQNDQYLCLNLRLNILLRLIGWIRKPLSRSFNRYEFETHTNVHNCDLIVRKKNRSYWPTIFYVCWILTFHACKGSFYRTWLVSDRIRHSVVPYTRRWTCSHDLYIYHRSDTGD